jgi:hypothetical protein
MQRYPEEKALGSYRRGEDLLLPLQPDQTLLIEISPAGEGTVGQRPALPKGAPVQKAFLSLEEVIGLLDRADFWPATPLPGHGNMPGF